MWRISFLFISVCLIFAIIASYYVAKIAVRSFENYTEIQVDNALKKLDYDWVNLHADGTLLYLDGLAANEMIRFKVFETVAETINVNRIRNLMQVVPVRTLTPTRYSLEMLRNEERVSLTGLIAGSGSRDQILSFVSELNDNIIVADMLEVVDSTITDEWELSVQFGLSALKRLNRSKISVMPGWVRVTALSNSMQDKNSIERFLQNKKPINIDLEMDISAPLEVISPFIFRINAKTNSVGLIACSANTVYTQKRILRALSKFNIINRPYCQLGLGVPTTDWILAIERSLEALHQLGGGVLTIIDTDISLVANDTILPDDFNQIVINLEKSLPELFSLQAKLPLKLNIEISGENPNIPTFTADLAANGFVKLQGHLSTHLMKETVYVFSKAIFGNKNVVFRIEINDNLPKGWSTYILGGLEALSTLHRGRLVIRPNKIEITGIGAYPNISSEVSRIFSSRIGVNNNFKIDIGYDDSLIVVDKSLTDSECERQIQLILDDSKINFVAGSAVINAVNMQVIGFIADVLRQCPQAHFEIGGHTDNQGKEESNLYISQNRAKVILMALLEQRILITNIRAKGYGSQYPIADNSTVAGRQANRRIDFRMLARDSKIE